MAEYRDKVFENQEVRLDGNSFSGCTFRRCVMLFRADRSVSMVGNKIEDVKWTFDGPGSLTYSFLMALYHGGGEGGRQLVEKTFDQIRKGQKPALP